MFRSFMKKMFRGMRTGALSPVWRTAAFVLSLLIVFSTTYALINPAVTLSESAAEESAGIYLEDDGGEDWVDSGEDWDDGEDGYDAEAEAAAQAEEEARLAAEAEAAAQAEEEARLAAEAEAAAQAEEDEDLTEAGADTSEDETEDGIVTEDDQNETPEPSGDEVPSDQPAITNSEIPEDGAAAESNAEQGPVITEEYLPEDQIAPDGRYIIVRVWDDGNYYAMNSDGFAVPVQYDVDTNTAYCEEETQDLVWIKEGYILHNTAGDVVYLGEESVSGTVVYETGAPVSIAKPDEGVNTSSIYRTVVTDGVPTYYALVMSEDGTYFTAIAIDTVPVNRTILAKEKEVVEDDDLVLEEDTETESSVESVAEPVQTESAAESVAEPVEIAYAEGTRDVEVEGADYMIHVTFGLDACIPENAVFKAVSLDKETDYDLYAEKAIDAVAEDDEKVKDNSSALGVFDLTIYDEYGNVIQPAAPIGVSVDFGKGLNEKTTVNAVHFPGSGEQGETSENSVEDTTDKNLNKEEAGDVPEPDVIEAVNADGAVNFEANSFSVYVIVGTETIETTFLTADGKTLKVTVNYDENAKIPQGASLNVDEICEGEDGWMDRSLRLGKVLEEKYGYVVISDVRFLDIKIMVDGKEFEPKAPVEVHVDYEEEFDTQYTYDFTNEEIKPEEIELGPKHFVTVHYVDNDAVVLDSEITEGDGCIKESVTQTTSFSAYDFVYFTEDELYTGKVAGMPSFDIAGKAANEKRLLGDTKAAGAAPEHHKTLVDKKDGTYDIHLNVTGEASTESQVSNVNVIIVYDTSTSMSNSHNYAPYYAYTQNATGRYGIDGNGDYFNLYYRTGNNRYAQLTNDSYTGAVYRNAQGAAYGGDRFIRTTRADVAEPLVRSFVNSLYSYQNPSDPTNIQTSFITFNSAANSRVSWTTNSGDITSYLRADGTDHSFNSSIYASGTNWERALREALTQLQNRPDNDPTYVVFITDGAPTTSATITTVGTQYEQCYTHARDEARSIQQIVNQTGGDFYSIYAYGDGIDWLATMMYYANNGAEPASGRGTTFSTKGYYNAEDTAALAAAIGDIFDAIVETLGVTNVSIDDGTTSNVELSTGGGATAELLDVDTNSFRYTLSWNVLSNGDGTYRFTMPDKTTGEDVNYTVSVSGDNITISWAGGSASYKGNIDLNKLTVEWTAGTPFYRPAPPAAQFIDPDVKWNLNTLGTLLNGVTYDVAFECYPSQYTLDLIADLKNGKVEYDSLDENIKKYLKPTASGNDYVLATNTTAVLHYTDTRTDEGPKDVDYDNPDPVSTSAVKTLAIAKEWENQLDEQDSTTQEIDLHVTRDGTERYDVILNKESDWKGQAFISVGIMTIHDGVVTLKTTGHDFSFEEPDNLAYHWEIEVPVVHPMMINKVDTMLLKVTGNDIPSAMIDLEAPAEYAENGTTYYKLGSDQYYRKVDDASASLTAVNHRRSTLNVTKVVTGEGAPADALFDYTIKINDPENEEVWFSIMDENGNYVLNTEEDTFVSGATEEIKEGSPTGYYYASDENGNHVISFKLKKGWNLRFINLPTGTTYEVEESSAMPDECFSFVKVEGDREYYESGDGDTVITKHETTGTIAGAKMSGTIAATNSVYTATYTNKYEAANVTVEKVTDIDDGSTFVIIAAVMKNGSPVSSLPIQSDQHVTAVEGSNNQLRISLKSGEQATLKLPVGTTLSIQETENSNYTPAYSYKITGTSDFVTGSVISSVSDGDLMRVTNSIKKLLVSVWKTDANNTTLTGASFALYKAADYDDDEGKPKEGAASVASGMVGNNGILNLGALPIGEYRLVETAAPAGYIAEESAIRIVVEASKVTATIGSKPVNVTVKGDTYWVPGQDDATWQVQVLNNPGVELPMTGGIGTTLYYLFGSIITLLTGVLLMIRRKRAA